MKITTARAIEVLQQAFSPQQCRVSLKDHDQKLRAEWFDPDGQAITLISPDDMEAYLTRSRATDGCWLVGFIANRSDFLREHGFWVDQWDAPDDLCPKEKTD